MSGDEVGEGRDGAAEHRVEVSRSARYWTLGPTDSSDVWIVLHGYAQLARRFLRRFEALAAGGRLVVAPEALSRFYIASEAAPGGQAPHAAGAAPPRVGASWMTREDREAEIRDYVAYLDRLAEAAVPEGSRVSVLGFSQGVATAWRWAALGRVPGLVRLVAWSGGFPHDLDMARAASALANVEVVLVGGALDRTVGLERMTEAGEQLRAAGVAFQARTHARGHDIHEETLLAIAGQGSSPRTPPRT